MFRMIFILLVIASQAFGFGVGLGAGAGGGKSPALVASADAPAGVRAAAQYVCSATTSEGDDALVINRALADHRTVILSEGAFYTRTPIVLSTPSYFSGSGVKTTRINFRGSTGSVIEVDNTSSHYEGETTTFVVIRDMDISGGVAGGYGDADTHCIHAKSDLRDLHIQNVFTEDAQGYGIYSEYSTWGWCILNTVVEFNETGGIYHGMSGVVAEGTLTDDVTELDQFTTSRPTISGTLATAGWAEAEVVEQGVRLHGTVAGSGFVAGETVTQATSGATGVVRSDVAAGSGIVELYSISGTFNETNTVTGGTSSSTMATPGIGPGAAGKCIEAVSTGSVSLQLYDVVGTFGDDDPITGTGGGTIASPTVTAGTFTCYAGDDVTASPPIDNVSMHKLSGTIHGGIYQIDSGETFRVRSEEQGGLIVGNVAGATVLAEEYLEDPTGTHGGFLCHDQTTGSGKWSRLYGVKGTFPNGTVLTGKLSGGTYTLTSDGDTDDPFSASTSVGPKYTTCKIQQNEGHQIQIDEGIYGTLIANSEIQAAKNGYAGIYLKGPRNTAIQGNRFLASSSGSLGYILLGADGSNSGTVYCAAITGNLFIIGYSAVPAIASGYAGLKHTGIAATGNTFDITYSGTKVDPIANWYYGLKGPQGRLSNAYYTRTSPNAYNDITNKFRWQAFGATASGDGLNIVDSYGCYTNGSGLTNADRNLPAALVGMEYEFLLTAADALEIDPNGTETLSLSVGGSQEAAGKYATSSTVGSWLHLRCVKEGEWECIGVAGSWTAEP